MTDSLYTVIVYFLIINVYVSLLKIVLRSYQITLYLIKAGAKIIHLFISTKYFANLFYYPKANRYRLSALLFLKAGAKVIQLFINTK